MNLPAPVANWLEQTLGQIRGGAVESRSVSGGCICNTTRIRFQDGSWILLKWLKGGPPGIFDCEQEGLNALRTSTSLRIPEVLAFAESIPSQAAIWGFLALEDLTPTPDDNLGRERQSEPDSHRFDQQLGWGLAELHNADAGHRFGWDRDNFLGTTPQSNGWRSSWPEFFRAQRLEALLERLEKAGKIGGKDRRKFDPLLDRLPGLLGSDAKPSLVHGDLWSGNVIADPAGAPALIDPAVSVSDPEVDLAMMRLFGGFSDHVFAAYREKRPPRPGHEDRVDIYNLYHLLNHALLFGGGYLSRCLEIARRY